MKPFDAGLATNGPQLLSVTRGGSTLKLLDDVGTFFGAATPEGKLEIRGAAAVGALGSASGLQSTQGFGAFGGAGFNSPSLLGLSMSAPYLHDGSAQTLEDVMAKHKIDVPDGNGGTTTVTIQNAVTAQQLSDLLNFVRTIEDDDAAGRTLRPTCSWSRTRFPDREDPRSPRCAGSRAKPHMIGVRLLFCALQLEVEHHVLARSGIAADGRVESHRCGVVAVGQHPGLRAAELACGSEQHAKQRLRHSAPQMARRDADLVDPQLRRLVGMDVVHGRGEADDDAVVDRDAR